MSMIHLPEGHNHTTRRFSRSMLESWPQDHAACIELPQRHRVSKWVVLGPMLVTVLTLALLLLVRERHEERRAITRACEAVSENPAACRDLFLAKGAR